jgi:hypothetical protein
MFLCEKSEYKRVVEQTTRAEFGMESVFMI